MSKFTNAIERNWPDFVIAPGAAASCAECCSSFGLDPDGNLDENQEEMYKYDEGSFSWRECESCGSKLGGDRHNAHAIHKDGFGPNPKNNEVYHIDICTDCLMFHANGDEPEVWE